MSEIKKINPTQNYVSTMDVKPRNQGVEKSLDFSSTISGFDKDIKSQKDEIGKHETAKLGVNDTAKKDTSVQEAKKQSSLSSVGAASIASIDTEMGSLTSQISQINSEMQNIDKELSGIGSAILAKQASLLALGAQGVVNNAVSSVKGFFTGKNENSKADAINAQKQTIQNEISQLQSKLNSEKGKRESLATKRDGAEKRQSSLEGAKREYNAAQSEVSKIEEKRSQRIGKIDEDIAENKKEITDIEKKISDLKVKQAEAEKRQREEAEIEKAKKAEEARIEKEKLEQEQILKAQLAAAEKDPKVPTKTETVETVLNKPVKDEVTVDKWDAKKPDNNDCLTRIVKNNYGVEPSSPEGQKIMATLMEENGKIYDAGRKETAPSNDKRNTVLYDTDVVALPTITEKKDVVVEDKNNPAYQAALKKANELKSIDPNSVVLKNLEATLSDAEADFANKKGNNGVLGNATNAVMGLFGQGDKKAQIELDNKKALLEVAKSNPADMAAAYKAITGQELDKATVNKMVEAEKLTKLVPDTALQLVQSNLQTQYETMKSSLEETQNSQGWLGKAWDGFKNVTGVGAGSNKAQTDLAAMEKQIKDLGANPQQFAASYKALTGNELTAKELTQMAVDGPKNSQLANSDAAKKVADYKTGQVQAVDTIANVASGVASVAIVAGATAAGIVAAPFTAGASLGMVAGGVALAGTVGAAVNVGMKGSDAATGGREYGLKDAGKDALMGSFNGVTGVVSLGAGNAITQGVKGLMLNTAKNTGMKTLVSPVMEGVTNVLARGVGEGVTGAGVGGAGSTMSYWTNTANASFNGALDAFKDGAVIGGALGFAGGAIGETASMFKGTKALTGEVIDAPFKTPIPERTGFDDIIDGTGTWVDDLSALPDNAPKQLLLGDGAVNETPAPVAKPVETIVKPDVEVIKNDAKFSNTVKPEIAKPKVAYDNVQDGMETRFEQLMQRAKAAGDNATADEYAELLGHAKAGNMKGEKAYKELMEAEYDLLRHDYFKPTKLHNPNIANITGEDAGKVSVWDQQGWHFRVAGSTKGVVDRVSVSAEANEQLIKNLDELISSNKINAYYKTPRTESEWLGRKDPITIYLKEPLSEDAKKHIINATKDFVRDGVELSGDQFAKGLARESSPLEPQLKVLVEKAKDVDSTFGYTVERWFGGGYGKELHASAGQVKVIEDMIENFAKTAKVAS